MTKAEGITVLVYTRWHQLAVPLALMLSGCSFLLVVANHGHLLVAIMAALISLLIPPLIAFKCFPTRNLVNITPDGLEFSRRTPVSFAELSNWGTDNFLKLVRPGYLTLFISPVDVPNRERLLQEFEDAFKRWECKQPPESAPARRIHFYGSMRGRLVGALIVGLGLAASLMALNLREPSIALAVVAGLGALYGLGMVLGKRK